MNNIIIVLRDRYKKHSKKEMKTHFFIYKPIKSLSVNLISVRSRSATTWSSLKWNWWPRNLSSATWSRTFCNKAWKVKRIENVLKPFLNELQPIRHWGYFISLQSPTLCIRSSLIWDLELYSLNYLRCACSSFDCINFRKWQKVMICLFERFHWSTFMQKLIVVISCCIFFNMSCSLFCLGLVLKDLKSTYEPGKRHWLKVKKDYLNEGAMADSADLVVLGAWYGTGNKGGLMSVFLMGCYDEDSKRFLVFIFTHFNCA